MSFLCNNNNKVDIYNGCEWCGLEDVKLFNYPCTNIHCNVNTKICPECSIDTYSRKKWKKDEWDGAGSYDILPNCPYCRETDYIPMIKSLMVFNNHLNDMDPPNKRRCFNRHTCNKDNLLFEWRNVFNKFLKSNKIRVSTLDKFNKFKCNAKEIPQFPIEYDFISSGIHDLYLPMKLKYDNDVNNELDMRIINWKDKLIKYIPKIIDISNDKKTKKAISCKQRVFLGGRKNKTIKRKGKNRKNVNKKSNRKRRKSRVKRINKFKKNKNKTIKKIKIKLEA